MQENLKIVQRKKLIGVRRKRTEGEGLGGKKSVKTILSFYSLQFSLLRIV